MKKGLVILMCLSFLSALFGCKKKQQYILDGPGMVNVPKWASFTVSRSDSYAQHNFWFTVTDDGANPTVTGECRDQDGNIYENEEGIPISFDTVADLRFMKLDELPTYVESPPPFPDVTILDESSVSLSLVYTEKWTEKKSGADDLSLQIYKLLLPYFTKNQ